MQNYYISLLVLIGLSINVRAADVYLNQAGASWGFVDDGVRAYDAKYFPTSIYGLNLAATDDAFDGAGRLYINGTEVVGNLVSVTSDTVTYETVTIGGLNVNVVFTAFDDFPILREMVTLTNPTVNPITVDFDYFVNWGSDDNTTFRLTSSGDKELQLEDRWVVSDDNGYDEDPVVTTVYYGMSANITPAQVTQTSIAGYQDYDRLRATFEQVTVGPNESIRFLFFFELSIFFGANRTALETSAPDNYDVELEPDNGGPARLARGLDQDNLNTVVNWGIAPIASPIPSCCTQNFKVCYYNDDYCNANEANCSGQCNGNWFPVDESATCTARWDPCNASSQCCNGLTCVNYGSYSGCGVGDDGPTIDP